MAMVILSRDRFSAMHDAHRAPDALSSSTYFQATIAKCGDDGATPADLANCPDLVHAQFDLLPSKNRDVLLRG